MATLYSSLYDKYTTQGTTSGAPSTTTTRIYKGLRPEKKGEVVTISGQYDLSEGTLNATNTQLFLCELVQGSRITGAKIWPSADVDSDNNFTFNLGTVASATAYESASADLQAVTGWSIPATIETAPAGIVSIGASESLILARQAGDLNSTGTLYFSIEMVLPV